MSPQPRISFVIATRNRRDITLGTLAKVFSCASPADDFEVILVDNDSSDGTLAAVQRRFAGVITVPLADNLGSCAKAAGVKRARGQFVVFLDDDSCPRPGSLPRMLEHFADDPELAAAGFRVHLPDGREEGSALPDVFVGCGVGLRAAALHTVGGLDDSLFMQAEEYDLAFRLVNAGWKTRVFDDLHVDHLKTAAARRAPRTTFYDTRNNLLVAARYLPNGLYRAYRRDWSQRYRWMAACHGHRAAYWRARLVSALEHRLQRQTYAECRLSTTAVETLFRLGDIEERLQRLRADGVRRIVLADLGKNIFAYWRGAVHTNLAIAAVADDRFANRARAYRKVPLLTLRQALSLRPDAVVVANTSPIHARQTARRCRSLSALPIHCWFGGSGGETAAAAADSASARRSPALAGGACDTISVATD